MVRIIRIDDEVWQAIARKGRFGETANDVLRRVFGLDRENTQVRTKDVSQNTVMHPRRQRRRWATRRMRAMVKDGKLYVGFEGGASREWVLPSQWDKDALRRVTYDALEFAEGNGATNGQLKLRKLLLPIIIFFLTNVRKSYIIYKAKLDSLIKPYKRGGGMMEERKRIAQRLRHAREAAGLTQAEVATVLGLPRPSISQIEAGERAVRSEELTKLVQLYGKPASFFIKEKEAEEVLTILYRGPNVLEEDREPLERGFTLCKKYRELEAILGLEPGDSLQFKGLPRPRSKSEAIRDGEFVARKARDLLQLGSSPIGDLAGLLEVHGVRVVPCPFRDDISGAFIYTEDVGPCILVNSRHRSARQNFTLAHEYCHTLLDWERRAHLDLTEFDKDPVETRADVFAAALLMPKEALEHFLRQMGITEPKKHRFSPYDVARTAAYFHMSHLAVLWRLFNLKYINQETREVLQESRWTEVAAELNMPEIMEDIPDRPRKVSPERLQHLAVEAYRRGRISLGKLAEYLGMDLYQVRTFVYRAQIEQEENGEER